MTKRRNVFEIDGKIYYSPKIMAERWQISYQAVAAACKEGRIVGVVQDLSNNWCIPDTAMKPLDKDSIRKILIITLSLKNTPDVNIVGLDNYDILTLYRYLRDTKYIKEFNENSDRIPYEATLTEKGMELVINNKKSFINWSDIGSMFIQCIPSFLEIGTILMN